MSIANAQTSKIRREVNLNWEPIEEATKYEIKVTRILKDNKRKKPLYFKLKKPHWKGNINPGQYEMSLRSYDDRNVPGDWSEPMAFWVKIPAPKSIYPPQDSSLAAVDDDEQDLTFKWEPIVGAEKYRLEVESADGKFKDSWEPSEAEYEVELDVAKSYNWRVTAIMPEGEEGEKKAQLDHFTLMAPPLNTPTVEKPGSKFVRILKWEAPEHTKNYSYSIMKRLSRKEAKATGGNKWQLITVNENYSQNELEFDLANPSGTYKIIVQAHAPNRESSEIAQRTFKVKGGFRTPAAVEEAILKHSIEKPTNFYGIASYFLTSMNYSNTDGSAAGITGSFDALGGTGRLGIGYQNPKSNVGYFAVIDLSGFSISGENYTFAAAEIHATYALNWGKNLLRLGGGLYMKELPVLKGNHSEGFDSVEKMNTIGPHLGFVYWRPFTPRYGLQLNSRVYYSVIGSGPNGEDIKSGLSMQFGAMGSYRLSDSMMGFAGYAYRKDYGAYKPENNNPGFLIDGTYTTIQIQGHYLNMILEYSF